MQSFLITLLICSVTMSALALLYMAAMPFLAKRYSAAGRYYAWLIIVIGLIIPFRPQFSSAIVKVEMPRSTAAPVFRFGNAAPVPFPAASDALPLSIPSGISWWQIAAAVWLAGMALFFAYHTIKHCRFLKLAARWSENVTDEPTLTLLQNLKAQMGFSRDIRLQVCACIGSPMLTGFANPRILLPKAEFAEEELCFILKHELVHCTRKDLWYKCLMLTAAAIHWFNPIVHLTAKAISLQCELSCDEKVVRSTDADTRLYYSEAIIGVVRYKSKLKTALSTHFYGGKNGMKTRIFSIMDMSRKKTGTAVLCAVLMLTLGTGSAFAAKAETQNLPAGTKGADMITPWIPVVMYPNPGNYTPYAAFGLAISEDGTKLLYKGQPVRLFADAQSDPAFYFDGSGNLNLEAVRNSAGEITGIENMTAQKAQKYYESFFKEELDPGFFEKICQESLQEYAEDMVNEGIQNGENKYQKYQSFGVTYSAVSAVDGILNYKGQRVKFFIDQPAGGSADALWTDASGTVNLAVIRDASGQITGIESISDEKAQKYQTASDAYRQSALNGLEEKITDRIANSGLEEDVTARMKKLYPNGIE